MPVLTRAAKRLLVDNSHAAHAPHVPQNAEQPPLALFIPEILFQIGCLLNKPELWSCSLVCCTWHSVFSPFLDWMALDNCKHYVDTLRIRHSYDRSNYHYWWGPSGLFLDLLLERVARFDAHFGFHSSRNIHLSNEQLEYHWPKTLTRASNEDPVRIDLICLVAERSSRLSRIVLDMEQSLEVLSLEELPRSECRWTKALRLGTENEASTKGSHNPSVTPHIGPGSKHSPPLSMVSHQISNPLWPCLTSVSLEHCHLEYFFIRILLSMAPALTHFTLSSVAVSMPRSIYSEKEETPGYWETNVNMKASKITYMTLLDVQGLQPTDVFQFALKLPHLQHFNWDLGAPTEEQPSISSLDPKSRTILPGFRCLWQLILHRSSYENTKAILQRVSDLTYYFQLRSSPMDQSLVRSLTQTLQANIVRDIFFHNVDLIDCEHAFHVLLSTLRGLSLLEVCGGVMVCDPEILGQTRWVCSDLRYFAVKPKCDIGSPRYSANEAQEAFMRQSDR